MDAGWKIGLNRRREPSKTQPLVALNVSQSIRSNWLARLSKERRRGGPRVALALPYCHGVHMTLGIRSATAADVSAMHSLRKRVRENRLSRTTTINELTYLRYIDASSAWIAESETKLVGFAAVDAAAASIWALFVDPPAQGQGVGRALHSRMLEWAKRQGIGKLSLGTEAGSRAVQFYQRAGWYQVGLTRDGEALFEKAL